MKKKILLIAMLFMVTLLTGCGSKDKVVIYSSLEEERNKALKEQLKEKFPDITVDVQYMATGNSAAKIKNEGSNIEADIVLALAAPYMAAVSDNFADISNYDTSNYLEGINNTKNYLIWEKYTMGIIIDKDYFEEHNLKKPTKYEDLLRTEYKGIIAMPDPKTSGTGYGFFLNAVNVMGEEKAVEYFKKLKENIREFTTSGSGTTNLLKQKEVSIAFGEVVQGVHGINEGYNFEIIELETGTPYDTSTYGIIKGKENKPNVQKIFEWLINDFNKYDKEHFMPDKILKDQEIKIENFPTNLRDADMTDINSSERKQELLKRWAEING